MLSFLLLLFITALPLQAETPSPQRVGVDGGLENLSLREAIEMALGNNLEIEIERSNAAFAQRAVDAARGPYDPRLYWLPAL